MNNADYTYMMADVIDFLDQFSSWQIVLLILLILIIEVFLLAFPKEIVLIYAGLKFGTIYGGIINLLGLFGAAWLGFEGGYYGRFGLEKRRNHPLLLKYQNWLNRSGLKVLLILRLFPFTPNDVLSISSGFTRLRRGPFLLITFLAAIPYAFLFSYVGVEHIKMVINLFPQVFDLWTWLASFVIIAVIAVYIVHKGSTSHTHDRDETIST